MSKYFFLKDDKPFMQLSVSNVEYPFLHLHVPLKQTDNGCVHCAVSSHESFNCRFPSMK